VAKDSWHGVLATLKPLNECWVEGAYQTSGMVGQYHTSTLAASWLTRHTPRWCQDSVPKPHRQRSQRKESGASQAD
jgi:hypothetical protein